MHVGESLQSCIANSTAPSESVFTVLPCRMMRACMVANCRTWCLQSCTQAHLGITTMPDPARMTHLTLNIQRKLAIHISLHASWLQNLVKLHAWTAGRYCTFSMLKFASKDGTLSVQLADADVPAA